MEIQGFFDKAQILRLFIALEYAFEVTYPNKTVRIAHHKGTWYVAKLKDGAVADSFEIQDWFTGHRAEDELTDGLLSEMEEKHEGRNAGAGSHDRGQEGLMIEDVLRIWAGNPDRISGIAVVQPGRNASLDPETGEFRLNG